MSKYLRCVYFIAGALLVGGPVSNARAQDANRALVLTPSNLGSVVDHVQKLSGEFKDSFDKAVSHSMIDGTRLETNARHRADDLHDAANRLGDVFHDKRDKNSASIGKQADKTIAAASELNRVMTDHRFTDSLQRQWDILRSDLNALAEVYHLSPLETGGPSR